MKILTNFRLGLFTAALAAAGIVVSTATVAAEQSATQASTWSAWGGEVGVRWNRELLEAIGVTLEVPKQHLDGLSWREHERFALRQAGSLEFHASNGNLSEITGGSLQARGGYVLDLSDGGTLDLTDFRLRPKAGNPLVLELVGNDGKAWFYIDRLMYELVDDNKTLAVRAMDLRISKALADRLGHSEAADWAVADMQLTSDILTAGTGGSAPEGTATHWHGEAAPGGNTYQADLFMQVFTAQFSRCNGCATGSTTGQVVFTPSSTLRNNVNNGTISATIPGDPLGTSAALYTADIPWFQKFTGNFAPYGNDQHPYLIWNLYRLNTNGSIDQIGRSGVKHAFLTTNQGCLDTAQSSHILARGCSDTYGTGNNDSSADLGPRSEIIPATNEWGRCGSIYDINCDGVANSSGNTQYSQRMVTVESDLTTPGATYLFESWYLARQDVNIYNSMATKTLGFSKSGTTYSITGNANYKLGGAIDRWVDPVTPPANAKSAEIVSPEGHTKVAVKAVDLGGGNWRYDYAVMNFDFARAITSGSAPNLRVIHNYGYDQFSVLHSPGVTISAMTFSDGDQSASNDWTAATFNNSVRWTAPVDPAPPAQTPPVLNPLNWGTLFRFSFVANAAPSAGSVQLHVAQSGEPAAYDATVLAPQADPVYQTGFDSPLDGAGH